MRLLALLSFTALVTAATSLADPTKAAAKEAPTPGAAFDRDAASAGLSGVDLRKCRTTSAPRGEGHVRVTFTPAGTASQALIDRGPMLGTPAQKCLERAFKKTKVPAFTGTDVQVGKIFKFD